MHISSVAVEGGLLDRPRLVTSAIPKGSDSGYKYGSGYESGFGYNGYEGYESGSGVYESGYGGWSGSSLGSGSGTDGESSQGSGSEFFFNPEYVMIVSEYIVTYTVQDCGIGIKPLQGYYDVSFAPPFTLRVDVEQVRH